jgi:aminomuconate-semialdehyde/2-hydroxymuconate-6-semialdehyde dehydrogenase
VPHPPSNTLEIANKKYLLACSDVDEAVKAAQAALPSWSRTPREQRASLLFHLSHLLSTTYLSTLSSAESSDQGKPLTLASSLDIPRVAYNFRFFASQLMGHTVEGAENDGVSMNYVQRMPVGVCALISPWNLPLYLLTWKIAPAIACKFAHFSFNNN